MKLSSKTLAVIIAVVLFGGIVLSNNLGWWNTSGGGGQGNGGGNGGGGNGQGQSQQIGEIAQDNREHTEGNEAFDGQVRGKTTFQDLLDWGVPQATIEGIIGGPIPDTAQQVSAYCQQRGISFGHVRRPLQEEVDSLTQK